MIFRSPAYHSTPVINWKNLFGKCSDGLQIGVAGFLSRCGARVQVSQESVAHAVDPSVYCHLLSPVPSITKHRGLADVGNLLDDVKLAEVIETC